MTDSVSFDGEEFISSKRASRETGYTQDYIGQLARGGSITAKRIGGHWYISLPSLRAYKSKADEYKPQPPAFVASAPDVETTVSFDGKDFVSAAAAAKLSGYSQDYIGQLARSGKVLSRQIGNRWFIERDGLERHKSEKDRLAADIQVRSVGLSSEAESLLQTSAGRAHVAPSDPFFTYSPETVDLMPNLSVRAPTLPAANVGFRSSSDHDRLYARSQMSARPMHRFAETHTLPPAQRYVAPKKKRAKLFVPLAGAALTIVVVLTFGFTGLRERALYAISTMRADNATQSASSGSVGEKLLGAIERIGEIFSHELHYTAKRK